MWNIDDEFLIKKARNNLIEALKKRKMSDDEIQEVLKQCDKEYKENNIPYPTLE